MSHDHSLIHRRCCGGRTPVSVIKPGLEGKASQPNLPGPRREGTQVPMFRLMLLLWLLAVVSRCLPASAAAAGGPAWSTGGGSGAVTDSSPLAPVFFWRFQKVGSSAVAGLLLRKAIDEGQGRRVLWRPLPQQQRQSSSGRRGVSGAKGTKGGGASGGSGGGGTVAQPMTPFCRNISQNMIATAPSTADEVAGLPVLSLNHAACDTATGSGMRMTFGPHVQEVAIFREPVARACSGYYFFGELFSSRMAPERMPFQFHGGLDAPPMENVRSFTQTLTRGFPALSWTWRFWARNPSGAAETMRARNFVVLLLERMDESLVLLQQRLGWTLPDIVSGPTHRKQNSAYARVQEWSHEAAAMLNATLSAAHELEMYEAAQERFEELLHAYPGGRDGVQAQVEQLRTLRQRANEMCEDETVQNQYSTRARKRVSGLLPIFATKAVANVERVDAETVAEFFRMYHGYILDLRDVCALCEAHKLVAQENGVGIQSPQDQHPPPHRPGSVFCADSLKSKRG